jgi:hypothetical protein
MKRYTGLGFLVLFSSVSFAAPMGVTTNVEPIIGYERTQKFVPTPRTRERLVYGARVTVGLPLISAEAEYTRAGDSEVFPATSTTIGEIEDKARIGLRSNLRLTGFLSFFLRAGAQARQIRRDTTVGASTTSSTDPIQYNPYAGAGLRVGLGGKVAFIVDVTTVFRSFPNMNNNDYMTSASLSISVP